MKVIITGVAGFIGGHAARRFLAQGATVIGIDNLSRRGNTENLDELRQLPGDFTFACGEDTQNIIHVANIAKCKCKVSRELAQLLQILRVAAPREVVYPNYRRTLR